MSQVRKPVPPIIPNLNQTTFDSSHSQSPGDTSHLLLVKIDKSSRTSRMNASKVFPDSTAATKREQLEPKKPVVENLEPKHALDKRRNSADGTIIYDYHGPMNSDIQQLLEDLEGRSSRWISRFITVQKLFKMNQNIDAFLKKKLPPWLVESKGPLGINADSIILLVLMFGAAIYFGLRLENTSVSSTSQYYDVLNTIHNKGAIFSFVFTLYGLLFLSLSFRWVLTLLVIQSAILVFLCLADLNLIFQKNGPLDVEGLTIKLIIGICGLFWTPAYPIYKLLRRYAGRFTSHLYVSIVCIVIAGLIAGLLLLSFMTQNKNVQEMLYDNSTTLLVFFGIIVSSSWLVIHFKYFWVPSDSLEATLKQIARKEAKKYTNKSIDRPSLTKKARTEDKSITKRLADNVYWVSSLIIGSGYIAIEMFLAERMLIAFKDESTRCFITAIFFFVSIPLFLLIGIPIGLSKGRFKDKSLVLPLVIMIPMFGVVPLSNLLGQWSDTVNLAWYLILGPPAACMFWLAMAFLELRKRRVFYTILGGSCVFFFVPFVLLGLSGSLLFSSEKSWFEQVSKYLIICGVVIFGTVFTLLLCIALYKFVVRKVKESKNKKLEKVTEMNRASQLQVIKDGAFNAKDEIEVPVRGDRGFEDRVNEAKAYDEENGMKSGNENVRRRKEGNTENSTDNTPMSPFAKNSRNIPGKNENKKASWVNLIYINLKRFGYWINAAAFIVSYTFVAYALFNIAANASSNQRGVLVGVTVIMPCIFLINNMLIRMRSTKFTTFERKLYLSKKELETKLFQADLQKDTYTLKKASIIEVTILVLGILLIPSMLLPLFFIMDDRQNRITIVLVMICSFLVSIFAGALVELKKRSGPYHKFFIPAFVGLCWIFIVLPFFIIIPLLSILLDGDEKAFEYLVKGSLTGSAFLLMIGVTALAIVINVFFQKLEEEKLIKFIVRYLQKTLKENAVLAGDDVVRRLIEHYLRKVPEQGLSKLKAELVEENFPIVPIYPPKFIPSDRYNAKLLLYETHNRFLKAMAGGMLKAQLVLQRKKTLFERLLKCCADEHDDYDFDFDLNMDYMGDSNKDAAFFRVDDYLPDGVSQPQFKWHAMLQEGATTRNSENPLVSEPQSEQEPKLKISSYDAEYKDSMTPKLASIVLRSISKEEAKVFNRGADAIRLQRDPMELEIWYQHLYDYLSGRLKTFDEAEKSPGIIYKNLVQFLRIACINTDKDQVKQIFVTNAKLKPANISYLSYAGFVQTIYDVACLIFPAKSGYKLLKAITKQIFPNMMRISDVAKNYGMVKAGFTKIITPYEPQLEVFERARNPPESGGMLDVGMKIGSSHDSPALGDGSFEVPLGANVNMMSSSSSWNGNMGKFRRSPTRKFSGTLVKRQASMMQEAEDEISIAGDLNTAKTPKLEIRGRDSEYVPVNTSFGPVGVRNEVKLSKFGNAVNLEDPKPKFERSRRKKKSLIKKVGRNVLLSTASCCSWVGKKYDYVAGKIVAVLIKISDFIYKSTKGIGKALGFALEEEHMHTEDDEFLIKDLRKDAPAWPILVDKLLKEIPRAENLYYIKYYKNGLALMFNFANVFAILNKLQDFFSYSIIAFTPEIPWVSNSQVLNMFQTISWELNFINFKSLFWLAVSLVTVTIILAIPSIHYLRTGRLGEDKHGNKAQFPSPQFFLVFIISNLAGSAFCQIMKCLLDTFVCDFDSHPWVLQRDPDILCLSDQHLIYMGIAALAIFIYYPISTFMYPNFQFQDKVLDLKYEPSFLVLNMQAQLVLTGLVSFFKSTTSGGEASAVFTKLIGTIAIMVILALITLRLRPCLIKGMNLWEVAGYLAAAWINASGLVVYVTGKSGLGFAMVALGVTAIFGVTLYVVKRGSKKKFERRKRKIHVQKIEHSYVRYDSMKRSANVPEEVKNYLRGNNINFEEEGSEREQRMTVLKSPGEMQRNKFRSQTVTPYVF